ncbi:MAG: DUF6314 family protein [Pseudomonadota bacterium]
MPTDRVLADFAGQWAVARTITPDDGAAGQFTGHAVWVEQGSDLLYTERGTLQIAGAPPMHAERRYVWTPDLHVFFEDGRFFHSVPAAGGGTQHWCDPDQYKVIYDFSGWPAFQTRWRVDGPRKGYDMTTLYRRAAP